MLFCKKGKENIDEVQFLVAGWYDSILDSGGAGGAAKPDLFYGIEPDFGPNIRVKSGWIGPQGKGKLPGIPFQRITSQYN